MNANDVKQVLVVGAGVMGHSIAQVFAQAGIETALMDLDDKVLEHGVSLIKSNLATLAEYHSTGYCFIMDRSRELIRNVCSLVSMETVKCNFISLNVSGKGVFVEQCLMPTGQLSACLLKIYLVHGLARRKLNIYVPGSFYNRRLMVLPFFWLGRS